MPILNGVFLLHPLQPHTTRQSRRTPLNRVPKGNHKKSLLARLRRAKLGSKAQKIFALFELKRLRLRRCNKNKKV